MSGGKITSDTDYIGSVVGYIISGIQQSHTATGQVMWGITMLLEVEVLTLTMKHRLFHSTTVDNLNNYATSSSWSKWLLNTNNKTVTFKVNNGKGFNLSSQLILLPDPANTKTEFRGWFTDSALTEKFTASEVATDTTLYDSLGCIVTFDGNGGTPSYSTKTVTYDSAYGELPSATRTGYTFDGWYTEKSGVTKVTNETKVTTANDHTLYAQWNINSYTITFISDRQAIKSEMLNYNVTINYPEDPTKIGYTFDEWEPNPERIEREEGYFEIIPPHRLRLLWPYTAFTVGG